MPIITEKFVIHVVMTSCEIIKPCAYIPSVPMTLDLQRELLLLAQAKMGPSYTHLLAFHEASFPSPAKVFYFIIQDSSSIAKCVLPVGRGEGGGGVKAFNKFLSLLTEGYFFLSTLLLIMLAYTLKERRASH